MPRIPILASSNFLFQADTLEPACLLGLGLQSLRRDWAAMSELICMHVTLLFKCYMT